MVPSKSGIHGSPARVKMIWPIAIKATSVPAMGVHKPGMRRIPDPTRNKEVIVVAVGGSLHSVALVRTSSAQPTTKRMRSKPTPGQPPANVEYKRRNVHPFNVLASRLAECESKPQKELGSSLFRVLHASAGTGQAGGNYSSMIPLFSPIIAACVRSLAPNLERMDLTRLLTVSSVMES